MRASLLLALCLSLSGCLSAHRVRIESNPPGAMVSIRGQELGPTPIEVTTLYFPFRWYSFGQETASGWRGGRTTARISAPGYRPGRVRMGYHAGRKVFRDTVLVLLPDEFQGVMPWRWKWGHFNRLFGISPRYTHQVQLIRRHGRPGTWTPEDAERGF